MRSGTTLVFNVLRNHPDVFSQEGEPKFFEYLPSIRNAYPDLGNIDCLTGLISFVANTARFGHPMKQLRTSLVQDSAFSRGDLEELASNFDTPLDYTDVFVRVWDRITARQGKKRWFAKIQPFYAGLVAERVPAALFTNVVRDPRAVLASKKSAKQAIWKSDRYPQEVRARKDRVLAYHPVWDTLSWRAEVRGAQRVAERWPDRCHSLTYEALVTDPEREFGKLFRQLGLTFSTELLGVSKNSSHASERDLVGISSSSVKRWAEVLRDSEVATIQWLASTEMNEYGYDIEDSSLRSQGAVSVHVLSSVPSLMKRLIDRYRLGGATLVSSVLRNYAKRLLALR